MLRYRLPAGFLIALWSLLVLAEPVESLPLYAMPFAISMKGPTVPVISQLIGDENIRASFSKLSLSSFPENKLEKEIVYPSGCENSWLAPAGVYGATFVVPTTCGLLFLNQTQGTDIIKMPSGHGDFITSAYSDDEIFLIYRQSIVVIDPVSRQQKRVMALKNPATGRAVILNNQVLLASESDLALIDKTTGTEDQRIAASPWDNVKLPGNVKSLLVSGRQVIVGVSAWPESPWHLTQGVRVYDLDEGTGTAIYNLSNVLGLGAWRGKILASTQDVGDADISLLELRMQNLKNYDGQWIYESPAHCSGADCQVGGAIRSAKGEQITAYWYSQDPNSRIGRVYLLREVASGLPSHAEITLEPAEEPAWFVPQATEVGDDVYVTLGKQGIGKANFTGRSIAPLKALPYEAYGITGSGKSLLVAGGPSGIYKIDVTTEKVTDRWPIAGGVVLPCRAAESGDFIAFVSDCRRQDAALDSRLSLQGNGLWILDKRTGAVSRTVDGFFTGIVASQTGLIASSGYSGIRTFDFTGGQVIPLASFAMPQQALDIALQDGSIWITTAVIRSRGILDGIYAAQWLP